MRSWDSVDAGAGRAFERFTEKRFGLSAETTLTASLYAEEGSVELAALKPMSDPQWIDLREEHQVDRRLQVVQHLRDLGYLGEKGEMDGERSLEVETEASDERLAAGLALFYEEAKRFEKYISVGLDGSVDAPDIEVRETDSLVMENPLRVRFTQVRRLALLTSLEGEAAVRSLPGRGVVDLRSRVIWFRLRSYNLVLDPSDEGEQKSGAVFAWASAPFSGEAERLLGAGAAFAALEGENSGLRDSDLGLRFCNLMGDCDVLWERYLQIRGETTFRYELKKKGRTGPKGGDRFARGRTRRMAVAERFGSDVKTLAGRDEQVELFGLELAQTFLWIHDYYLGEIDAAWGKESHLALKRAVAEVFPLQGVGKAQRKRNRALRQSVLKGRGTVWVFDPRELVAALRENLDTGDVYEKKDVALDRIGEIAEEDGAESWDGFTARVEDRDAFQKKKKRRRYFGVGSFVRSIVNIANRTLDWLRRALRSLFGPALKFLRFIGRGLKTAMGIASLAFRQLYAQLTGKPMLSGSVDPPRLVATWQRLDKDAQLLIATKGERFWVDTHLALQRLMARSLRWVVEVGMAVAQFAAGPIGWVRGSIRLFRTIREILEAEDLERMKGSMLWV